MDVTYPSVSLTQLKPQTTQTNKIGKNKMAQRKETKKNIKVRDLKPKRDAKGGVTCFAPKGVTGPGGSHGVTGPGHGVTRPGNPNT